MVANIAAGVTYQFTRPVAPLRFSVIAAGIHETQSGASGFSATAAGSYEAGPMKLGANVRADKLFASGRDKVDLFTLVGASFRVMRAVRIGAEYVAQDLEDLFENDEEEGGARYAIGPTLALDLDGGRYQITLASGFGLTAKSPRANARAALVMNI